MFKFILLFLIGASVVITGCSNVKPYKSSSRNNLAITSKTDSGVNADIDIYHVDKDCKLSYQGTVSLDKNQTSISLSENQLNYLVISFTTSSFWSASTSSMSKDALLKPEKTYHYHLDISYIDNIYNIELKATHLKSKSTTDLEMTGMSACHGK